MKRLLLAVALCLFAATAQAEIRVQHGFNYQGPVYVRGYYRQSGTYVNPYYRSYPSYQYSLPPIGGDTIGSGGFQYNPYYNPYYQGMAPQQGFYVPSQAWGIYGR